MVTSHKLHYTNKPTFQYSFIINNNNNNNGNLYSAHIHSKSAQGAVYKLSWNSNQLKQKYNTLYIIIIIRMNGTFI